MAVFLCIAGVLFTMQPWRERFDPDLVTIILGYGVACLSGFLLCSDIFIVRHYPSLKDKHNQNVTLFWMYLTGVIISAPVCLIFEEVHITYSTIDWVLIAFHCVSYGINMAVYMYACSRIPGVLLALIRCTITVYLLIAQYTVLADEVHGGNHNILEVLGAGIVIIGTVVPAIVQALKSKAANGKNQQNSASLVAKGGEPETGVCINFFCGLG